MLSRRADLPSGPAGIVWQPREFSLRSWRLCERLFLTGHDRKRGGEADRGRGLPHSYQPRTRSAGIGLRSGPGIRVGKARLAHGPAAGCSHNIIYQSVRIETGFRADLIVEDKVIVEIQ